MKFTHRWLLQHIHTDLSPQALGDMLTLAGLELEGLVDLSQGLAHVQTGRLLEITRHPNADRLTLCQVQVGSERLSIVCGASNHRIGDVVAVAREGASLPNGLHVKKGHIRGQLSEGMLCSRQELGLSANADVNLDGILIFPPDTPDGRPVAPILERHDHLFELGLTPNRGDCLGVRGIARELGALLDLPLHPIPSHVVETAASPVAIVIEDGDGCPRYAGRVVRGVSIGPSPAWLRHRLEAVGLRSINNVVDVTNFVLLDLNQPLHAFDLAHLHLPITVRRARSGEVLRTLDGEERLLTSDMTLIADTERPLALAGIMGGEASGVTESTTDIVLESAYFDPVRTARTGRKLGITSDSRYRFERGTDPEKIQFALDVATRWIVMLAGGEAEPATLVDAGTWILPPTVLLRPQRINTLGGMALSAEAMQGILTRLGCQNVACSPSDPVGALRFQPPSHRHDLRCEEDLLEEIVRVYGYDRIPSSLPPLTSHGMDGIEQMPTVARLRRILGGRGYLEAINYAFISYDLQFQFDHDVKATALLNPISADQAVMRTCLVAGLLENSQRNLARGNQHLRLFEVGGVFLPHVLPNGEGGLLEPQRLAALLTGPFSPRAWHTPQRETDFFDLKGDLEAVLRGMGVGRCHFEPGGPPFLHPGRKATIFDDARVVLGWIGQIHPAVQETLGLSQVVHCFELLDISCFDAAPFTEFAEAQTPVSRFPSVERDFAFVVDANVPAQHFLDAVDDVDPALIRATTLFDLYTGQHVPEGYKSLAVCVRLQADDRTLTEQEVQRVADRVVALVGERFGASLR